MRMCVYHFALTVQSYSQQCAKGYSVFRTKKILIRVPRELEAGVRRRSIRRKWKSLVSSVRVSIFADIRSPVRMHAPSIDNTGKA